MIRGDPFHLASPIRRSPPIGGNAERGRNRNPEKFTADTCRKCSAITIAGTIQGIRHDLEPNTLNDHTEYQAIADNVPTYDLWPDRIARRRWVEHIRYPDQTHRHAQHTCGTTYGTTPRPTTSHPRPPTDGPPPF